MKIASHNSFTYLQPWNWWMQPFAFMARCQRENWIRQYEDGVQLFDLRVRFDRDTGLPYICHGLMRYFGCPYSLLGAMSCFSEHLGITFYVRVVLERKHPSDYEAMKFRSFCKRISERYKLLFFGGNDRSDWGCRHPYYKFKTPAQDLDDKYSSTTTLFPRGFKWLRYLDDLCPILYARLNNRRNIERGTSHEWLFIDFVDIR